MKKIVKVLLVLGFGVLLFGAPLTAGAASAAETGDVKIDAAGFPDNFFREYVAEKFDTNKDGILQRAEAEAVTGIKILRFQEMDDQNDETGQTKPHYYTEDEYAFNFKGIEKFTNLSKLELWMSGGLTKNNAKYVVRLSNVDSLYKLKNLKILKITNTDMTSLDCSLLPKLENLYVSSFKNLKKINFKGCGNLKKIQLEGCQTLKTLDVSPLKSLTTLCLADVNVGKIKYGKKNKSIKTLDIGGVSGALKLNGKNPTSLNLSKLAGLKKLYIQKMKKLKKLDLSHNKNLRLLTVDECNKLTKVAPVKNKKLEEVSVWNDKKLKTLDLSANAKLKSLSIQGMKVKTIRLNKKNKLSCFRYAEAKLKSFNVKNINTKTLKQLQLFGNKLKKINVRKYKKLESLDVDKGVKVIGQKKN